MKLRPEHALAVTIVAAFPALMWLGRSQWFFLDEWDFLANRELLSINELLRPHNEHWSTLPVISYRLLWNLGGIRNYEIYQSLVVAAHLAVASLLWVVMRRARVNGWLAILVVVPFIFLGSGAQNIVWAFQIGFVGSIMFGLVHLVLADHDGPFARRDKWGLVAGVASLASSGIGVVMVAIVGFAVLLRRGWKTAALHAGSLGAIYLLWYAAVARHHTSGGSAGPRQIAEFSRRAATETLTNYGQSDIAGLLVAGLLVSGLAVIWVARHTEDFASLCAPLALAAGAAALLILTGWGRAAEFGTAIPSRYVHMGIAFVTPLLGLAVHAAARRSIIAGIVAVGVLWVGLLGNIDAFSDPRFDSGDPTFVLGVAYSDEAPLVPSDTRSIPFARAVSTGWLLDAADDGRLPDEVDIPPARAVAIRFALLLEQREADVTDLDCRVFDEAFDVRLEAGESVIFDGPPLGSVRIIWRESGEAKDPRRDVILLARGQFRSTLQPLDLRFEPRGNEVSLCT